MKLYFAYCQGDILLTTEGDIPFGINPPILLHPWNIITTLHEDNDEYIVIQLSAPVTNVDGLQMVPLRKSFEILSQKDYQLAGKCAELIYFNNNSKFCGVCGAPMKWQTEISKQCPECHKELWPSLATAIIVRISKGDEILMVHARTFRDKHYGLVAGFVETGETLEQCVEREVWEEVHLKIKNIRYFGSQPWPYPSGLMVGFTADYESGDISLQRAELSDGGWYNRNNLPELPGTASIAYSLIQDWLKNKTNETSDP